MTVAYEAPVRSVAERDAAFAELTGQIAEVCGVLNVAHARLVALVAQAIDEDVWRGIGVRSVEHFLCWQAGLSPSRAHQVADIARRYDELPRTIEAFTRGELSVDQVATVAQRIPAEHDESAAEIARSATVNQLRRVLVRRELADPPDDADAEMVADEPAAGAGERVDGQDGAAGGPDGGGVVPDPALADARLSMGDDGTRFFLHLDAPVDVGQRVRQALAEARDRLRAAGRPASWADALLDVCERSVTETSVPRSRRDRYRVYLHLDVDKTRDGHARGWVNQGPALPPTLIDKLVCDAALVPLWTTQGRPVSLGRTVRTVPPDLARLIKDRDGSCASPGCFDTDTEAHHIIQWLSGGPTDTTNLISLCDRHHDLLHAGEFSLTGDADQPETLRFTDRHGRTVPAVGRPIPPPPGKLPGPPDGHTYHHPTCERMQTRWISFPPVRSPSPPTYATQPDPSPPL